jgi:serine/threonine protein kinase
MEPLAAGDPQQVGVYRLRARLGAGGMGRVFLGFSPAGRAVAVKIVHPELARDPDFIRRFGREVRAAEAVGGVYTAPVVAHGVDDDPPWIATAFIAGPTLADVVEASGPLPEQAAWRLVGGLAEALQAIHGRGLVHRDLKPANVLLAADGPRVIDFGISRALEGTVITRTSAVMGTPGFMSPEQVTGLPVEPASDIFALGSVLAFAASGRSPFAAADAVAVAYQIVHAEPDLTGVPDGLLHLVTACLVKEPARRPGLAGIIATVATAAAGAGSSASFWPPPLSELVKSWQDRLGPAAETPQPVRGRTTPAVSADRDAEPTRMGNRGAVMAVGGPGSAGPRRRKVLAIAAAVLTTAAAFGAAAGIAIALSRHPPTVAASAATGKPATSAPVTSAPRTSARSSAPTTPSPTPSPTASTTPAPVLSATVCTHPYDGCGNGYLTTMQVRPPDIYISGDGSLYIKGIAWYGWGYATATGYGILEQNDCKPDCAEGTYYGVAAQITLSVLLRYGSGPPAYAKMVISAPTSSFGTQTFTQGMVP